MVGAVRHPESLFAATVDRGPSPVAIRSNVHETPQRRWAISSTPPRSALARIPRTVRAKKHREERNSHFHARWSGPLSPTNYADRLDFNHLSFYDHIQARKDRASKEKTNASAKGEATGAKGRLLCVRGRIFPTVASPRPVALHVSPQTARSIAESHQ